jgi:4-amino-4-deoxy-L-arabinose transferase-like glycosyltransferase
MRDPDPTAMPEHPSTRLSLPIALAATSLLWLFAGLYAREPWKADEAYSIGIVLSMVQHGEWIVPTLGGEPFMEKPPLMFWAAALFAKLLDPVMPLHVAARMANVAAAAATFVLLGSAARQAYGRPGRRWSIVLLAGCPAWIFASRYLTADLGLMPAAALVCLGMVRLHARKPWSGTLIGVGATLGLLAKGLLVPGAVTLAVLLLPILSPAHRNRFVRVELVRAALAFGVLGSLWPLALIHVSRDLFWVWLWDNNFARFLGGNNLGPTNERWTTLGGLALVLLPSWPLAIAAIRQRRARLRDDVLFGPTLLAGMLIAVLLAASTSRSIYALPALVPLSLVGGSVIRSSRDFARWQLALPWSGIVLAGTAIVLYKGWLVAMRPEDAFASSDVVPSLVALVVLAAFAWIVDRRRSLTTAEPREHPLGIWTAGFTIVFASAVALNLPGADRKTAFKSVFTQLGDHWPASAVCVASRGLGESERGMLEYYTGRTTRREELGGDAKDCPWRLEQQRTVHIGSPDYGCPGRTVRWTGQRPGDDEVFRLCAPVMSPN